MRGCTFVNLPTLKLNDIIVGGPREKLSEFGSNMCVILYTYEFMKFYFINIYRIPIFIMAYPAAGVMNTFTSNNIGHYNI